MPTTPPRVATWLAQHLIRDRRRDSLIGDLIEQHEHGRSSLWYWRQVLQAILVGSLAEAQSRPWQVMLVVLRRLTFRVVLPLFAAWMVFAAAIDRDIGWVVAPALVGGVAIGALLLSMRSRHHARLEVDSFQRGRLDWIIDSARIRIAGIGGFGLVVMSAIVAVQYGLISVALVAGVTGGAIFGVLLILYRRRRHA